MAITEELTHVTTVISHRTERNFGLDLMRACAIIMVFLSHTNPINPLNPIFPWFGWLGAGVEAFFVLSGYLIGRIILRTLFQPEITWKLISRFWVNRWLRTIPAYLVVLAIEYALTDFVPHGIVYLFFGQNLLTPMPGFFPHSWSLAVEEWFYLLFPVAMFTIASALRMRHRRDRVFILTVCCFLAFGLLAKFSYRYMYQHDIFAQLVADGVIFPSWKTFTAPTGDWANMRKIVLYRIDAIAYGCLVAYIMAKYKMAPAVRQILLLTGLCGLLGCFVIVDQTIAGIATNIWSDVFLLPLFCCAFALMLPATEACPRPRRFLDVAVTSMSKISYSFYLLHLLVVDRVISWYEANPEVLPKWAVFVLCFTSIYIISLLLYRLVELPFMNLRQKLFRTR